MAMHNPPHPGGQGQLYDAHDRTRNCVPANLMKQTRSEPLYPAAFLKMLSRACTSLHVASSDCQSSGGFPFFSIAAKTA